jgi:hypothetical protein
VPLCRRGKTKSNKNGQFWGLFKPLAGMLLRILFVLLVVPGLAFSQSTNISLNEDYYHWIDRYEIKAGRVLPEIFTTVKPYKRSMVVQYIDSLEAKDHVFQSASDQFNYEYLRNDSWEWSRAATSASKKPLFKYLYKKKSDMLFADIPGLDLHVSPVFYFGGGKDSRQSGSVYTNTRGVELRGMIDQKIGFYTFFTDNQGVLPMYVQDQMRGNPVVPHEGFWKQFKTNGVDYFQARAYIDFNLSKHVYMQFGNDRTFIGNGLRSLIFSDYSPPNLYLRANLKIWKINYLFQINQMTADAYGSFPTGSKPNVVYPTKYVALHHASIDIGKKFNLGLFESVVFNAGDSLNRNPFELSYLNPVIFYRAVEQQSGSPDNVLVGADFKYNAAKRLSFYGQLVIDEFVLQHLKSGDGWWANKFATQLGLKYIDVAGIQNLDLQLEGNIVRPYTYSHDTEYGGYSNYNQSLAHPLGANFYEAVAIVRYQPLPRLNLVLKSFYNKIGRDTTNVNWGSDILKNNSTRQQELGNKVGQGVANNIGFMDFCVSYQLKHNLFIDVRQVIRKSSSPVPFYDNRTSVTSIALRLNIARRSYDF